MMSLMGVRRRSFIAKGAEVFRGVLIRRFIVEGNHLGDMFEGLFGEFFPACDGGEGVNFELFVEMGADVDGAATDGAGGAEDGDAGFARTAGRGRLDARARGSK